MAFIRYGKNVISGKNWLLPGRQNLLKNSRALIQTPSAIQEPPRVLITGNKNKVSQGSFLLQIEGVFSNKDFPT